MLFRQRTRPVRFGLTRLVPTVILAAAVTAACAQDVPPPDLDRLDREFLQALENKDYTKALEVVEENYRDLERYLTQTAYRIACMHCVVGHKDQAYKWLEKAVDAGYRDARRLERDDDFESIRKQERFRALVKRAWATGYIAMLEREQRAEYQKPDQVMAALALRPGERVADIGAGSGYFTIPVAKAVGPAGVVWALDIEQPLLDYIEKRLEKEKLQNVRLKLVPNDDPQLPTGGVDTILIVNTWHHIQDRSEYAKKLRAALAPGGRVVIIDYIPKPRDERPWGPRPEHLLARAALDAEFARAGLKPVKQHDFLPEQYFVEYGVE